MRQRFWMPLYARGARPQYTAKCEKRRGEEKKKKKKKKKRRKEKKEKKEEEESLFFLVWEQPGLGL